MKIKPVFFITILIMIGLTACTTKVTPTPEPSSEILRPQQLLPKVISSREITSTWRSKPGVKWTRS